MKILLFDIETAPTKAFVWKIWQENVGTSQIIDPGYMLCWAAKWLGEDEISYATHWDHGDDMVRLLHELLEEADAVVSYNGNHFDIPIVNTAFAKLGLKPPAQAKSIDLYQVVKRKFRLLSNRMDFVGEYFGLGRKADTGGFSLWSSVLEGDAAAREHMVEYNCQDVVLLEDIYKHLLPWIPSHPSHGLFSDTGRVCPSCGGSHLVSRGFARTKVYSYRRFQCKDCGAWSRERTRDKREPAGELVQV